MFCLFSIFAIWLKNEKRASSMGDFRRNFNPIALWHTFNVICWIWERSARSLSLSCGGRGWLPYHDKEDI